jgi:hypothetical protein
MERGSNQRTAAQRPSCRSRTARRRAVRAGCTKTQRPDGAIASSGQANRIARNTGEGKKTPLGRRSRSTSTESRSRCSCWLLMPCGALLQAAKVVRDFPGHERDDVVVSTDVSQSARAIIKGFSRRWSLEVSFHEAKGKLGFEDQQNRAERTAPLAFVSYSLTVHWCVLYGQHSKAAKATTLPWYAQKTGVCFSDMLAALRRASWRERLLDPGASASDLRKRLRPLVNHVATAA